MEFENIKTEILAAVNLKFEEKLQDLKLEISHQISSSFDKLQSVVEKKIDETNVRFNQQINDVEERLLMQENDILHLHQEIATLKSQNSSSQDRSLRSTLIFRGIDYNSKDETNSDNTVDILATKISAHCPNIGSQFFKSAVERGHRNFKRGRDPSSSSHPPSISVKFLSWKDSNHILNTIIQSNKNNNSTINSLMIRLLEGMLLFSIAKRLKKTTLIWNTNFRILPLSLAGQKILISPLN